MKQLNEKFEDKEYKIIKKAKDQSGLTWREFLVKSAIKWMSDK